jgi:holo-[acyl-carrier protein] synthase
MIVGIGIDVVSIARISKAMRRERFVERILAPAEREQAHGPRWVAGRWAAKEAVVKALGRPVPFRDIVVTGGPAGAPVARVSAVSGLKIHVSISHDRESAVAMAIVERPDH